MTIQGHTLTSPYDAYHNGPLPPEDELTLVEKGTAAGEYLRRFWQPVALASEIGDVPKKVRIFGEDLVLFRTTTGSYGLLDRHCSHRGSSLEFGLPTEAGIRCCYHGWLYGLDGRILETPGDPPDSTLKDRLCHGAYPVREYKGIIFGYFGEPEKIPEFVIYDSYDYPDDKLVPYSLSYPCNWLQVHENVMDPAHAVFLHTRMTFSHFADAWGELPVMDFAETPTGMIYITTRRWRDKVWVRSNDIILPNLAQVGHIWEDGQEAKQFSRVGITRWTMPVDNENCKIIGWRHFHPEVNPRGIGREEDCGLEKVDFYGQTGAQTFEERQRLPGDYDAIVSQRRIANHGVEHLTYCDRGVVMLRRLLRREMDRVARGGDAARPAAAPGPRPTYCHDTVLSIPLLPGEDDRKILAEVGRKVTDIVVNGEHQAAADRVERIRALMRDYEGGAAAKAAE